MTPKIPLQYSIDYLHGYLSREDPDVQFEIIANLLVWFLVEHISPEDTEKALQRILNTVPHARAMHMRNIYTVGGVQ